MAGAEETDPNPDRPLISFDEECDPYPFIPPLIDFNGECILLTPARHTSGESEDSDNTASDTDSFYTALDWVPAESTVEDEVRTYEGECSVAILAPRGFLEKLADSTPENNDNSRIGPLRNFAFSDRTFRLFDTLQLSPREGAGIVAALTQDHSDWVYEFRKLGFSPLDAQCLRAYIYVDLFDEGGERR